MDCTENLWNLKIQKQRKDESLTNANYDKQEHKDIKESAYNIDDLNGSQIDKESELYKKYKTNIENFDYEDE